LGIRASFVSTAVLCALAFAMITALYREDRAEHALRRARPRLSIRAMLVLPGFLTLIGILFLTQGVDRGIGPVLPLFVAELDPTVPVASTTGLIISAGSLVSALAASQVGRVLNRRGARALLPISLLVGFTAS